MTLGLEHLRTVAFIGSVRQDGVKYLRGTGFFVGVPIPGTERQVHLYLVTASHVVPPYEATFVRIVASSKPHQTWCWTKASLMSSSSMRR
jgi:hypothetical protein